MYFLLRHWLNFSMSTDSTNLGSRDLPDGTEAAALVACPPGIPSNSLLQHLARQRLVSLMIQGRSQAIRWVGSLRTKSGPSNSFYNYGDFKTCMS